MPLTAEDIRDALDLCDAAGPETLLLLALPVAEAPVRQLHAPAGRWCWRGDSEDHGDDPVAALAALVARNAVPADRFIDPQGCPWDWVRPVRTGAHVVLAGFDVVLGGPQVRADTDVPSAALAQLPLAWVNGEVCETPAVLETADGNLLVGGDGQLWKVRWDGARDASRPPLPPARTRVEALARRLQGHGTGPVDAWDREDGDYVLTAALDGAPWQVDLPVRCTSTATTVGIPVPLVTRAPGHGELPAGWSWAGTCDGDLVAATPDGTLAYLRPRR